MTKKRKVDCVTGRAALASGIGLAGLLFVALPAFALSDGVQLLTGGFTTGGASPSYTSPGMSTSLGQDFPSAGQGENAAQQTMPAGVLRNLNVNVTTAMSPSSGKMTIMIRINNANTKLRCSVNGTGTCKTGKKKTVTINKGDRLAVRQTNNFVGAGNTAVTYTFELD